MKEFISNKVSKLRLAKGISARALSFDLEQCENYINRIENKNSLPSIEGLKKICDYFQISLSDFFDDKTEYPIQYRELLNELNKLDSQEIEKVVDFIKLITINKK